MRFFLFFLALFTILNCKEEIVVQTIAPELGVTSSVLYGDSIVLESTIISIGSLPIKKYGFAISTFNPPKLGSNLDVTLTDSIRVNRFSASIQNKLNTDSKYFVTGFVLTKEDTVYADYIAIDGKYRNPPSIESLQPPHGYPGDLVKIIGRDFDNDLSNLKVKFGEYETEIISASLDRISVKVPAYHISEAVSIVVTKKDKQSVGVPFLLDGPAITSFTPTNGMAEFIITIRGHGFSEYAWRNTVNISTFRNSTQIRYPTQTLAASASELSVKIDANNVQPGLYTLSVQTNDKVASAPAQIEITSPWNRVKDKPLAGVEQSANFEINGKLYVCAGTSGPDVSVFNNQLWEYNTDSNEWTRRADLPGDPRVDAFAFSINGKGYVGSGYTSNDQTASDLWQYDPVLDSWTQKTGIPNGGRTNALSFTYKNNAYVILGRRGKLTKDFWSYDPVNDLWHQLPDFGGKPRTQPALSIKNNKLFVVGGYDPNTVFDSDSWSYDFTTQQWSFITYVSLQARAYAYDEKKCYVLQGNFNYFLERELHFFEYDPETNTKTAIRPLFPGEDRARPGLAILKNKKIYVGFGASRDNSSGLNDLWVYPTQ